MLLTVVLFLVALVMMTLFILSGMPGFLKLKRIPTIVTVRTTKNLNNDTLIKDLNELPFELIRASADNPLVKLEIFLDILNKHAPVKTIRVRGNNLPYAMAEVKSMMRKRDYLRGKGSKTGSKYLQQAFQHLCRLYSEKTEV